MTVISRTVATVLITLLAASCGEEITSEGHIASAKQFLDAGDRAAATIELKNALQKNANSGEARWLLGKIYLDSGDLQAAEKEISRASELSANNDSVSPLLAQALLPLGEHEKLLALSVEELSTESRAVVLAAQGLSMLASRQPFDAGKRIDEALATHPESTYALLASVRMALGRGDEETARERIDSILSIDPGYAPAWSVLGDIELVTRNVDEAENAYSQAIIHSANSFDSRFKRALLRIERGVFDEAQQDVDWLIAHAPGIPAVDYARGLLYLHRQELDSAKGALELAAVAQNRFPQTLYYLAVISQMQNNTQAAESYLNRLLRIAPANSAGRKLAASIKLQAREFDKAEESVRPVIEANPEDVQALNLLANALIGQGKSDEAIELLGKVAELQPDSAAAQTRLGLGLIAIGDDAGAEHLKSAVALDPEFQQADILVVLNHLRQRELEKALKAAEDYRDRHPESAAPYNLLGRVFQASGDLEQSRGSYQHALILAAGDPEANHSLAELAIAGGDYELARHHYEDVLTHHKNYLPTLMSLAALDARQGKEQSMVQTLKLAISTNETAVEPRLILARYYVTKKQFKPILDLLDPLSDAQKRVPAVLSLYGSAHLGQKSYSLAIRSLRQLIELQPDMALAHFQLAMAHGGLDEKGNMRLALEKTIELDGKHLPSRLAMARLELARQDKEAFERHLIVLKELAPEQPDVLMLDAAFDNLQDRPKDALAKLRAVFERMHNPATVRALALQHGQMNNNIEARTLLIKWLVENPSDDGSRTLLADFYSSDNLIDEAIKQYRVLVETDTKNLAALNNLAWHLQDSSPTQALEYAERAIALTPGSPQVLDTLALVLLKNNRLAEARRSIDRALSMVPDDPGMRYHAAMIMNAAGDKAGALKTLEPLAKAEIEFAEKDQAVELLESLRP